MTTRKVAAASESPRPSDQQEASGLAWWIKALVSAALIFHMAAVFCGPFAFATSGPQMEAPLTDAVMPLFRRYLGALFLLDHGYAFFAPEVGPSHLVRYKIEFEDGREPVVGLFPDLKSERPRLLYHRHFMMSEALNNRFAPPEPPPEPSPPSLKATVEEKARYRRLRSEYQEQRKGWEMARRQYEAMWNAFAEHLRHEHGGSKVTLTRVEHGLADPEEILDGHRRLADPDSYVDLPETLTRGASR